MTRQAISPRLRREVIARSGGRCAFCRCPESLMGVTFEVDHVVPAALGGETVMEARALTASSAAELFEAKTPP